MQFSILDDEILLLHVQPKGFVDGLQRVYILKLVSIDLSGLVGVLNARMREGDEICFALPQARLHMLEK